MRVTREELYDQVWKTPTSSLARQYGISDVALAKICVRLNVPKPGRGHWARIASGATIRPPELPKPVPKQAEWVELPREAALSPRKPKPPAEPIAVPIPENLTTAHSVTKALGFALRDATTDAYGRLVVGRASHPVLAVTVAVHRRALLVLDALFKALTARGHQVMLKRDPARTDQGPQLLLMVSGEPIELALSERLDRRDLPVRPGQPKPRQGMARYEYFTSGRLKLEMSPACVSRGFWLDGKKGLLEAQLGRVVLAADAEAEASREARAAAEQRQREAEQRRQEQAAEERRQQARDARRRHLEALGKDVEGMARAWTRSMEVRRFLDAFEQAVPDGERSAEAAAWLAWARGYAAQLDPLTNAHAVPKDLEEDQLGEHE